MGRSIWAVVAGVLFVVIVSTLVDMALHAAKVYPPMDQPLDDKLALLATAYRLVISVAGAWLTAKLAPQNPLKHAVILGVVGTVLGTVGVITTWNAGLGPRWYAIALAVLAVPQCWLGGKLYEMQSRRPAQA
jgi:Co/Zn/Cd efflux system component